MPYCDHGHYTEEVKRMPTGSGAAILVCYKHYLKEIAWRRIANKCLLREYRFDEPRWDELPLYKEA